MSMELFAVFETWHIGDGNYPPLAKGELVNLSFEFEPDELQQAASLARPEFTHLEQAVYQFTGLVLRVYKDKGAETQIVVVQADDFRFYIHSPKASACQRGDMITGRGTLLLDHYIWVEYLSDDEDPPDLFYTLKVDEIVRYRIPERFITRSDKSVSYPTRVTVEDYGQDDVTRVDQISDDMFANFVVRFSDHEIPLEPIARTFLC